MSTLHRHVRPRFVSTSARSAVWLSTDPIGISGGLNQYVFCANNPVNARDPWGLDSVLVYGSDLSPHDQALAVGMGSRYCDYTIIVNNPADVANSLEKLKADGVSVDTLYVLDHGVPGIQMVGDSAFVQGQSELKKIGAALSENGRIELWGCNVAEGDEGEAYVDALAELSNRPVTAWSGRQYVTPYPLWLGVNLGFPYTARPPNKKCP